MKKTNSKKGFTLVELVIVIAVIAILSAILVPTFSSVIGNANATKEKADLKAAITTYIAENATTDTTFDPNANVYCKGTSTTGNKVFSYNNGEITECTLDTTKYDLGETGKQFEGTEWYYFSYTEKEDPTVNT